MGRKWMVMVVVVGLVTACIQPEAMSDPGYKIGGGEAQAQYARADGEDATSMQTARAPALPEDEWEMRRRLPDVVESVMPSVVGITTERTIRQRGMGQGSPFDQFFGQRGQSPQQPEERLHRQDVGSGVIVDVSGVVITNNHVIDGADSIWVNLSDGRELSAQVEGTDPESDIAVLKIDEVPDDLEAMGFGDSDALRLGESVIAIGNPFGLSGTVTLGIISATSRADVGILDYENFIQTDAAINPGNSGGALINLDGELVGINTAILTRSGGYQGIGFAIPSNMVQMVMQGLLEDGHVDRGWLGVVIQQLTEELAEAMGMDPDTEGVLLADIQEGSPADEQGLQRGDLVVSIDGNRLRTPQDLRNTVGLRSPGTQVEMELVRDGGRMQKVIELGSSQVGRAAMEEERAAAALDAGVGLAGLHLEVLDSDLRRQLNVSPRVEGVAIVGIDPGSEAARYDLREGDIIMEVNRQRLTSVDDFNASYNREASRNLFLIHRQGTTIFLTQ